MADSTSGVEDSGVDESIIDMLLDGLYGEESETNEGQQGDNLGEQEGKEGKDRVKPKPSIKLGDYLKNCKPNLHEGRDKTPLGKHLSKSSKGGTQGQSHAGEPCQQGWTTEATGCISTDDSSGSSNTSSDVELRKSSFVVVDNPRQWSQEHFGDWKESLRKDQIDAIQKYKDDSAPINENLRHTESLGYAADSDDIIKNIASAVKKGRVPHDMVVFRAAKLEFYDHLDEGEEFRDYGFSSTSISKGGAEGFHDPWGEGEDYVRISILVRKGHPAGYFSLIDNTDLADEMVLQAGTKYKVIKKSKRKMVLMAISPRGK